MKQKEVLLYKKIVHDVASLSHALRKKVGALIVKDSNIIAYGYNGTPAGEDNECETRVYIDESKTDENSFFDKATSRWFNLVTKENVIHAEMNAMHKSNGIDINGAALFVTMAPCINCAMEVVSRGITEVFYCDVYRSIEGLKYLEANNVKCTFIGDIN